MNYVSNAQPFVELASKKTIKLTSMNYVFGAQPFVRNDWGKNTGAFFHFF